MALKVNTPYNNKKDVASVSWSKITFVFEFFFPPQFIYFPVKWSNIDFNSVDKPFPTSVDSFITTVVENEWSDFPEGHSTSPLPSIPHLLPIDQLAIYSVFA